MILMSHSDPGARPVSDVCAVRRVAEWTTYTAPGWNVPDVCARAENVDSTVMMRVLIRIGNSPPTLSILPTNLARSRTRIFVTGRDASSETKCATVTQQLVRRSPAATSHVPAPDYKVGKLPVGLFLAEFRRCLDGPGGHFLDATPRTRLTLLFKV